MSLFYKFTLHRSYTYAVMGQIQVWHTYRINFEIAVNAGLKDK